MITAKDIGFFRKMFLILITQFQKMTLKLEDRDLYLAFTKLHFSLYFRKNLVEESAKNSREFKAAAERHGRMVISIVNPNITHKKRIKETIKRAFQKDLLLETKL